MHIYTKIGLILFLMAIFAIYISFVALVIEQYNQIPKDVKKTEKDEARYMLAVLSLILVIILFIILFILLFSYKSTTLSELRKRLYDYTFINKGKVAGEFAEEQAKAAEAAAKAAAEAAAKAGAAPGLGRTNTTVSVGQGPGVPGVPGDPGGFINKFF